MGGCQMAAKIVAQWAHGLIRCARIKVLSRSLAASHRVGRRPGFHPAIAGTAGHICLVHQCLQSFLGVGRPRHAPADQGHYFRIRQDETVLHRVCSGLVACDRCRVRRAAERHDHPGGRPGLFRHRLLRRRDQDAESGPLGRQRVAVHAVLQHGSMLADTCGTADRILCSASAPGHDPGREERRRWRSATMGSIATGTAQTGRLPHLSFGEMAHRRATLGKWF